jgi:hypothetical protein
MAKRDSTASAPKRGAFPTPRNILADAKPFKPTNPEKSSLTGDRPRGRSNSPKNSFASSQTEGPRKKP